MLVFVMHSAAALQFPTPEKMIHLVRHAEAEHNAGPGFHAAHRILDPSLKLSGWKQVEQLRKRVVVTGIIRDIELVVVSPLTRTLQTAVGVFGTRPPLTLNGIEAPPNPPLLASELCRELMTPYESNKRSPISKYKVQFPVVDFSQINEDEDVLWKANSRESRKSFEARKRAFLQWLMYREEKNIAVVSHGGFLKNLVNKCDEDGPYIIGGRRQSSFPNCELDTVRLTFTSPSKSRDTSFLPGNVS